MDLPVRGELWWAELDEVGARPVVVISRNPAILGRRRTLAAPCSTIARGLASEVLLLPSEEPVRRECVVQLDAVTDLPVAVLSRRLGRLSDVAMARLCHALSVAAGCS